MAETKSTMLAPGTEAPAFDLPERTAIASRWTVLPARTDWSLPSSATIVPTPNAMLAGEVPDADQKPGIGCNIKWKPGNSPDYFG